MDEEVRTCSSCGEEIEEDDDFETLDDGSIVCKYCYEDMYQPCDFCGEMTLVDDLQYWGDSRICPDCMQDEAPDFDEAENEEKTTEAYKKMREKYIGRKTCYGPTDWWNVDYDADEDGKAIKYYLSVQIGDDGCITDISRLTAEILLCESERSSKWKPYPIENQDYKTVVDAMMEDILEEQKG